jgi:hypothetical protein
VIKKIIRAIDTKTEFVINVLDALRMLNHAWSNVTSTTIENCYRHAGFQLPTDNTHSDGGHFGGCYQIIVNCCVFFWYTTRRQADLKKSGQRNVVVYLVFTIRTMAVTHMNALNRFIMNEHFLSLCTKQSDISSFFTQADSSSKQD